MLTGSVPFYSEDIQQMFYKIERSEIKMPSLFDADTRSIIGGLLERDVSKRLTDAHIRNHNYFKSIDWEKLYRKELPPPFIPNVKGKTDVSMIDSTFTKEKPVIESNSNDSILYITKNQKAFDAFDYFETPSLHANSVLNRNTIEP